MVGRRCEHGGSFHVEFAALPSSIDERQNGSVLVLLQSINNRLAVLTAHLGIVTLSERGGTLSRFYLDSAAFQSKDGLADQQSQGELHEFAITITQ